MLALPPKCPTEPPLKPSQISAHAPGPIGGIGVGGGRGSETSTEQLDDSGLAEGPFSVLRTLARNYIVSSNRANGIQLTSIQMCEWNAEVCSILTSSSNEGRMPMLTIHQIILLRLP